MSDRDTDFLLNLINMLLTSHSEGAPFQNHSNIHDTIDAMTLGIALWKSFTLNYQSIT